MGVLFTGILLGVILYLLWVLHPWFCFIGDVLVLIAINLLRRRGLRGK